MIQSLFHLFCSEAFKIMTLRLFLLNFRRITDSAAENEYSQFPRQTATLAEGVTKKGGSVGVHTGAYVYLEVF